MATTTAERVRFEDPTEMAGPVALAGFLDRQHSRELRD